MKWWDRQQQAHGTGRQSPQHLQRGEERVWTEQKKWNPQIQFTENHGTRNLVEQKVARCHGEAQAGGVIFLVIKGAGTHPLPIRITVRALGKVCC